MSFWILQAVAQILALMVYKRTRERRMDLWAHIFWGILVATGVWLFWLWVSTNGGGK